MSGRCHLLSVPRAVGAIALEPLDMTALVLELGRCDRYMEKVRGRAPKTRLSDPSKPRLPRRSRARDAKNRHG